MVIVHPMTSHRGGSSLARTVVIAVAIWVLSSALALLQLIGAHVNYDRINGLAMCDIYPPEWGENYPRINSAFQFVVYFALPIVVIAVFYVLMARMLMLSSRHMPGDGVQGQAARQVGFRYAPPRSKKRRYARPNFAVARLVRPKVVETKRSSTELARPKSLSLG